MRLFCLLSTKFGAHHCPLTLIEFVLINFHSSLSFALFSVDNSLLDAVEERGLTALNVVIQLESRATIVVS